MKFFSGFCFENEQEIFSHILAPYDSIYNVAGFSYGAQKALDFALDSTCRINHLILLSPAFFNTKSESFKKEQIALFQKNDLVYVKYFLKNIGFDESLREYFKMPHIKDLELLLYYEFCAESLQILLDRGIKLSIFLGGRDRIIDTKKACDFFSQFGVVYFLNKANHLLR